MTTIILDRNRQALRLVYTTPDHFTGTLLVPFTGPYAVECVFDPHNNMIHHQEFFADLLGEDTNLEPYLIGMTRSAKRRNAA